MMISCFVLLLVIIALYALLKKDKRNKVNFYGDISLPIGGIILGWLAYDGYLVQQETYTTFDVIISLVMIGFFWIFGFTVHNKKTIWLNLRKLFGEDGKAQIRERQ